MSEDELLCRNLAIYISNDFIIKKKFFKIYHDDFFLNHFARVRIENVIYKKYF